LEVLTSKITYLTVFQPERVYYQTIITTQKSVSVTDLRNGGWTMVIWMGVRVIVGYLRYPELLNVRIIRETLKNS